MCNFLYRGVYNVMVNVMELENCVRATFKADCMWLQMHQEYWSFLYSLQHCSGPTQQTSIAQDPTQLTFADFVRKTHLHL